MAQFGSQFCDMVEEMKNSICSRAFGNNFKQITSIHFTLYGRERVLFSCFLFCH